MSKITQFEDLKCWQEARVLANYVFDLCEITPLDKKFKLKNQMEDAALAVMNNIAEGFGRYHKNEFIRFLNIASSSCCEVKSMSYLIYDRKIIDEIKLKEFHDKINSAYSLVLGMLRYVEKTLETKKTI